MLLKLLCLQNLSACCYTFLPSDVISAVTDIKTTTFDHFNGTVEVTCVNISWKEPSCAIGYNITTEFLGLAYSTPDPNTTICGRFCRETIYIQPIDGDGDGGNLASITGNQTKILIDVLCSILMH